MKHVKLFEEYSLVTEKKGFNWSRKIKTDNAKEIVDFFEKNSDIYDEVDVTLVDSDEVEVTVRGELYTSQAEIDEEIDSIENHFVNIIGKNKK